MNKVEKCKSLWFKGIKKDTTPILWFNGKPYYKNKTYSLRCTPNMVDRLISHNITIWKDYEIVFERVKGKRFNRFYRFSVLGVNIPLFFRWCNEGISPDF